MTQSTSIETLREYVARLDHAIASGARQVTLDDQTITYNTTDSLLKARSHFQQQINEQLGRGKGRKQQQIVYSGRGY